MVEIFVAAYVIIGLSSYVGMIKWWKREGNYIDWEDLILGFICFGAFWIVFMPFIILYISGIGGKILDWVNK